MKASTAVLKVLILLSIVSTSLYATTTIQVTCTASVSRDGQYANANGQCTHLVTLLEQSEEGDTLRGNAQIKSFSESPCAGGQAFGSEGFGTRILVAGQQNQVVAQSSIRDLCSKSYWTVGNSSIDGAPISGSNHSICTTADMCCLDEEREYCSHVGQWLEETCQCLISPILISLKSNYFPLTDAIHGVRFDLNVDGAAEQVAWTEEASEVAFLALDRNNNGQIDSGAELFGNLTEPQSEPSAWNGFLALRLYDDPARGGNSDGMISSADSVFPLLRIWTDTNHDGVTQSMELHGLSAGGIEAISLDYIESRHQDRYRNEFRFRSKVEFSGGRSGSAYDVFLFSLGVPAGEWPTFSLSAQK